MLDRYVGREELMPGNELNESSVNPDVAEAPDAVAEFVGASKRFGAILAVDNLELSVLRGEFLSFLGPSGCGKTTALRMLAGFESPSEGDVLIDGKSVARVPAYQRPVNMVFQNYALFCNCPACCVEEYC